MLLGTEIDLGPGDIVLDGAQLSLTKRGTAAPPHFSTYFALERSPISAIGDLLFGIFWTLSSCIITSSIARSVKRRYISYVEAYIEVSRPAAATGCTDGVKFGMEEWTKCHAKFHPIGATIRIYRIGPPKLKFLPRFYRNSECKRSAGAYPLRGFHEIYRLRSSLDLLSGLRSYGGFKLSCLVSPKFSANPSSETMRRPQNFQRCKNALEVLYRRVKVGGLGFHSPPVGQKR